MLKVSPYSGNSLCDMDVEDGEVQILQSNHISDRPKSDTKFTTEYLDKATQAGKYLGRIMHSKDCRGHCDESSCSTLCRLIAHCYPCNYGYDCPISGCQTTKKLINHCETCVKERNETSISLKNRPNECLICVIAKKQYLKLNLYKNKLTTPNSISQIQIISPISYQLTNESTHENTNENSNEMEELITKRPFEGTHVNNDSLFKIPIGLPRRFRCASENEIDLSKRLSINTQLHTQNQSQTQLQTQIQSPNDVINDMNHTNDMIISTSPENLQFTRNRFESIS